MQLELQVLTETIPMELVVLQVKPEVLVLLEVLVEVQGITFTTVHQSH